MQKQLLPDIEKFAAYLDGNLPESEMQQFSQLVEHDSVMHQLLDASSLVDDAIANYMESGLQLPPEITESSFEIPSLHTEDFSNLVTLTPEPSDGLFGAVVAECADDSLYHLSDDNTDGDKFVPDSGDNSINLTTEHNGMDSVNDISGSTSEDF